MGDDRSVTFTPSAKARLEQALDDYRKQLESVISNENFVPGEQVIEATASDVEQAARRLRLVGRAQPLAFELITTSYAIIGLLITLAGIFYPTLLMIWEQRPEQFGVIATGVGILLVSLMSKLLLRRRKLIVNGWQRSPYDPSGRTATPPPMN